MGLDDVLKELPLEDKLELARRAHVNSLLLHEGNRVRASRQLRGSYIHEGLEDEGEDCRIRYDVPAGTLGRVVRVRQYVAPFPYVVVFDTGAELSLTEGEIERVPEQPSQHQREQDDSLWHIPDGGAFTTHCARWIDRLGRACPQYKGHPGLCGLPPA
ncbi:hypothetical protein ACFQ6C_26485 [Streptomyces sp. NPDC056454]|uniref:hypothetical protein n=1 Tax=Streptomyces sp. NPDC056454 TaxID=3345823 RepID=UPI0036A7360A